MSPHQSIIQPSPLMPRINTSQAQSSHMWGQERQTRETKKETSASVAPLYYFSDLFKNLQAKGKWLKLGCWIILLCSKFKHFPQGVIPLKVIEKPLLTRELFFGFKCMTKLSRFVPNSHPNFEVVQSNICPDEYLGSIVQQEQVLMTADGLTGLWNTHRRVHLTDTHAQERWKHTGGDWKCLNGLGATSLIIQLYIAKKLGSNCLTWLPASCFILISLIGYLICSPRLGIKWIGVRPFSNLLIVLIYLYSLF